MTYLHAVSCVKACFLWLLSRFASDEKCMRATFLSLSRTGHSSALEEKNASSHSKHWIVWATERKIESVDGWCTKLSESGHGVDQVQTVERVFVDHRIEPQVQFLQILQLVQGKDVLQRRKPVIVQIQSLQHLQMLNPLQTDAQQHSITYVYIKLYLYTHIWGYMLW